MPGRGLWVPLVRGIENCLIYCTMYFMDAYLNSEKIIFAILDEGINIEWKETHNQETKLADNRINENCGRDLMNRDVTEGKHSANSESDNLKIDNRGRITVPNGTEDLEEGEDANKTKLMESMSPRILSFFVPEDDDLTRKDVEELTFKIENVYAEEAKTISEEKALNNVNGHHEGYRRGIAKKSSFGNERFSLAQEQMRYLDYLQEMEVWIKMKFEKCHDCSRKRIYRRLLEVNLCFLSFMIP